MIVMAMATKPDLLIADEPTTALDVTVETQIFDLLKKMQKETETAVLLITHNLNVAADICQNVAVLYAGRCLEYGQTEKVLSSPKHPYTRGLLRSAPTLRLGSLADSQTIDLVEIPGQVPNLGERPQHCIFASRCKLSKPDCREQKQPFMEPGQKHFSACCP
jgi:peptide/nickel transport system ATP-binding protein